MKAWLIRFYHNLLKGFSVFRISKAPEPLRWEWLEKLAKEAEAQIAAGETEEGGFAIADDEKAMEAFYSSLPRWEGLYKRLADM